MNEITLIEIKLDSSTNTYRIYITKSFSPKYGGGEATIEIGAFKNIHTALDQAKSAITVTKSVRSAFEASGAPPLTFSKERKPQ